MQIVQKFGRNDSWASLDQRKASLRSKRFRVFFRPFEAFFAFWRREKGSDRNIDGRSGEGEGEGRKGNACPQTP